MQKPYLPHPHTHTQTDKHIQIITHKRTRIHHTNMHTHREIDRHIHKVAPLRFSLGLRPCTPLLGILVFVRVRTCPGWRRARVLVLLPPRLPWGRPRLCVRRPSVPRTQTYPPTHPDSVALSLTCTCVSLCLSVCVLRTWMSVRPRRGRHRGCGARAALPTHSALPWRTFPVVEKPS
jgi:hypothetical protein